MTGTAAGLRLVEHGYAVLPQDVNLQPTASGVWVDTGLQIALPSAGTYQLDANVRGNLQGSGNNFNVWLQARLWDITAGAVVPDSECIVQQYWLTQAAAASLGGNAVASALIEYSVPGPRSIRLEASRINLVGSSIAAGIPSNTVAGRTTLRYERIA
ncbi:hypothetical protein OOK58_42975 [Streptomyces sp. NBC_01728]|uniref:hypothetical protein n=1 Tax=unclassified Streptomyces TaxID=2593676 RepID=UPI0022535665|nr:MULTISPECIES: hypothetical protein [unclassified Streptomyces]MCX4458676.1 hypothetical protein [Streptomyces sp. NBC_01719]MCX4498033.1 hypothetical protein [Streptomyces sp. NBC_01728]